MSTFTERAEVHLGTPGVAAVNTGARRLAAMRQAAVDEYPQMDAMRDRARSIRLHTLQNLGRYLEQLAERVADLGGHVFWANDGDEVGKYVADVARERGAKAIVKSKSMVTEEIELNDMLESAGLDVVETDLGEFIVQLADDRPSHIIAPILHKTRHEVGELFATQLGTPYTDEPTELNAIARRHLREIFLRADMGISGVNFAVAETGSICTVTNEGNGRLTTTAPRTHVAIMGMERVVPTIADLAVMLEVLARSGTGQRLSVYTNIMTGARRSGDPDGPDEFHLVIVDNGRSNVLGGVAAEILGCIRCGACLNVCPVYRSAGGHVYGTTYSGPVGAVLTPALAGLDEWHDLPSASSLCGACKEVCPIRLDIPEMLLALRAEATAAGYDRSAVRRALKMYARAATRPAAFRAMLKAGGLAGKLRRSSDGWITSLPWLGSGWTNHRDFPSPASRPFFERWRDRDGR